MWVLNSREPFPAMARERRDDGCGQEMPHKDYEVVAGFEAGGKDHKARNLAAYGK